MDRRRGGRYGPTCPDTGCNDDDLCPDCEGAEDEAATREHAQPHCPVCGCDLHDGACAEGHTQADELPDWYCSHCGENNPATERHCMKCGSIDPDHRAAR